MEEKFHINGWLVTDRSVSYRMNRLYVKAGPYIVRVEPHDNSIVVFYEKPVSDLKTMAETRKIWDSIVPDIKAGLDVNSFELTYLYFKKDEKQQHFYVRSVAEFEKQAKKENWTSEEILPGKVSVYHGALARGQKYDLLTMMLDGHRVMSDNWSTLPNLLNAGEINKTVSSLALLSIVENGFDEETTKVVKTGLVRAIAEEAYPYCSCTLEHLLKIKGDIETLCTEDKRVKKVLDKYREQHPKTA